LDHEIPQANSFVASSGNVTDDVIIQYIEQQSLEPPDGDFKTDDDL
jgi:putative transposase